MARRSDHTQEQLKNLIITGSIKLITEIGPSAFGTRAIAKEIGYSFGTIYHLYGNLEVLRYHVKGRILDNWYEELASGMGMVSQQDKAKFLVSTYIELSEQQRFLWAFVFAMPSGSKESAPDWYIEKVENLFSLVIDAFEPITQDRNEAEIAARAMWPSIHGICVLAMSHKLEMVSTEPSKKLALDLLDIYMTGLKNIDRDPEMFTVTTAGKVSQ
ncbi:MAG: TetR/AcrR family transcriptional regulator [Gammaproteobacteria bacterium]|nr:TetR/AcrR family transcriptional regulator [Gammaproteobacteria bacterium]MBT6043760.1 TetR/AcrR family transcriptional regulator [Gammaproteobacteria bacterium]